MGKTVLILFSLSPVFIDPAAPAVHHAVSAQKCWDDFFNCLFQRFLPSTASPCGTSRRCALIGHHADQLPKSPVLAVQCSNKDPEFGGRTATAKYRCKNKNGFSCSRLSRTEILEGKQQGGGDVASHVSSLFIEINWLRML